MSSNKKKDLEIIFNLQWKYGPKVAERSNIVGVYDIPSTTLSWEPFKAYILKNSGTPGDDVKVSYMVDGKEFPIESTLDFQTALYAFRKKAMNGEIINLKLERLSIGKKSNRLSPTCDAQTECDYDGQMNTAPGWFVNYMAEFKKEILSEVATAVSTHTAAIKSSVSHSHYSRKCKNECSKRCRKSHYHDSNEKEVLKTLKLEKKLESKMEKLVHKSKKLKEKKTSLMAKSSDSDAGHSSSKSNSEAISNVDISSMNAAPLRCEEPTIPHFMGGEVYRHCWKVINNGLVPWTQDTELHFSWGSSLLQPIQKVIPCPLLNPMDVGEIEALIHVPKICGKYQMYWHFYHKGRKFGQWLGCEIIVDKLNPSSQYSASFLRDLAARYDIPHDESKLDSEFRTPYGSIVEKDSVPVKDQAAREEKTTVEEVQKKMEDFDFNYFSANSSTTPIPRESFMNEIDEIVIEKSPSKIQIIENYMDQIGTGKTTTWRQTNIDDPKESGDDDDSCDAEHLVIDEDAGEDSHSESISKIDEDASSNSTLNDMVIVNLPEEEQEGAQGAEAQGEDKEPVKKDTGYAWVYINEKHVAVPKKFLRDDFLETAEDAPNPEKTYLQKAIEFYTTDICPIDISRFLPDPTEGMDMSDFFGRDLSYLNKRDSDGPSSDSEIEEDSEPEDDDDDDAEEPNGNEPEESHDNELEDSKSEITVVPQKPQSINPTLIAESLSRLYPTIDKNDVFTHVPNYQQTLPELRPKPMTDEQEVPAASGHVAYSFKAEAPAANASSIGSRSGSQEESSPLAVTPRNTETRAIPIIPETPDPIATVVSGAMTMASSALKNVVNKIIPSRNEPGVWVNGHWVPTFENSIREKNLKVLNDMGFTNRDLNATLLARYDDDIRRVVAELVQ